MNDQNKLYIQQFKKGIHWIALAVLVYIFGYAGLYKLFGVPSMIEGMQRFGFGETRTLLIGLAEVTGVIGVIIGLFYRPIKIISLLYLLPFAIGAFTMHIAFQDPFSIYLNSLLVCITPLIILWTDEKFKLVLK